MSDLVFAADAETVMAIAPETQVWMLESLGRFEIEAFERARAVAGPRSAEEVNLGLRREEALQATLRQALWLGDREVARHPLRHVAARLGIELDEAEEDWTALAYEATRVLLDVSEERAAVSRALRSADRLFPPRHQHGCSGPRAGLLLLLQRRICDRPGGARTNCADNTIRNAASADATRGGIHCTGYSDSDGSHDRVRRGDRDRHGHI